MSDFECRFGVLGNVPGALLPATPISIPDIDGDGCSIEDRFSLDSDGAIRIKPNYDLIRSPLEPDLQTIDAAALHEHLPKLTANPPNTYPLPRLGVFFSNVYVNQPRVFGMMFDTGLVDPDARYQPVSSQPRQGCALFLQTIRNARPDNDAYAKQVAFDLAHEVGHIFNLQHVPDTNRLCFMNQSSIDSIHPAAAYKFTGPEQLHMAECGKEPNVTPGGAPFDPNGGGNNDLASKGSFRPSRYLSLHIGMAELEFWPWEDVQLDIRLSSTNPVSVPDELDPGYKNFEVWIETPSGERMRYRSPHHYCAYPTKLKIAPREPFVRDIPVFQQVGGYTFQKPGIHKLWVDFYPSRKTLVRSNVLSVQVKSLRQVRGKDHTKWAASRELHHAASRLLFFKSGAVRKENMAALLKLARTHPREHAAASARYTLGRLYHDQARRFPKQRNNFIQQAIRFLQAAADHSRLSNHRRQKASDLLAQMA